MKVRILVQILLVALVLAGGALLTVWMFRNRPQEQPQAPPQKAPLVRSVVAAAQRFQTMVRSQGTVRPRTESTLFAEVAGRVLAIAPEFRSGGFFDAGAVLVTIDPTDHELALQVALGDLARAERALAWESAEAEAAVRDWRAMQPGGERAEPPPLVARVPQLAEARAALKAAEAARDQARRDVERSKVVAPYAGRVREALIDVGAFVTRGTPVAQVYAVDAAEVRLPLPDAELAWLDLPLAHRGAASRGPGPAVTLRATFAGREHAWSGHVVRTEGEIDPRTRMVHAVALVEDPYAPRPDQDRPPLAAGMFVRAEIAGRVLEQAVVLPREALRGDVVLVIEAQRPAAAGGPAALVLRPRQVAVAYKDRSVVVLASGVEPGERVCLSQLEAWTDGMPVRIDAVATSRPASAPANGGHR
jgi:RND family efflux transporter MFP subunit